MADYRYLFVDLLTDTVQAELPLTGVNFTQSLNSSGALQGTLLLSGLPEGSNATNATVPAYNAIYVERDGVLIWGGIIWSRSYNSKEQQLSISAEEFESYLKRRLVATDQVYENVDQFTVAEGLVNTAQATAYGDIGIDVPTTLSGVSISRNFYQYELKTVLSALQDLSKSSTGFDFRIEVSYDSNRNFTKTLLLGYPRLGVVYDPDNPEIPVFEFPAGNVVSYEYPEDGSIVANKIYATGAGSNEGKLVFYAQDNSKLGFGWALLEDATSYSDIDDSNLLQDLAIGQVAAVSYPPTVVRLVAKPSVDPVLGSYEVGDDVRLRISDDRFPNGLDAIYRLTALSVTAGDDGPERVTLTLTLPTS